MIQDQAQPAKKGIKKSNNEHWPDISKIWDQVGPPLRPSSQDLQFLRTAVHSMPENIGQLRVLILGVTPEYYHFPWPENTRLMAADHTRSMIEYVWPGPRHSVICSNWTTLSIKPNSFDIVLCDGGLHLLAFPDQQKILIQKIHRLLSPGGIAVFRLFVPSKQPLSIKTIKTDILEGSISNLNELKMHLWLALQENSSKGVELHAVWKAVHQFEPNLEKFARDLNWPIEHARVINTYKNSKKRYYFSTFDDVLNLFTKEPGGFEKKKIFVPDYPMGVHCPTIVMNRTSL